MKKSKIDPFPSGESMWNPKKGRFDLSGFSKGDRGKFLPVLSNGRPIDTSNSLDEDFYTGTVEKTIWRGFYQIVDDLDPPYTWNSSADYMERIE